MRPDRHFTPPRAFAAERWILEPDARSAIVRGPPAAVRADALVGSTIRVDGCEYRCVAVRPDRAGARLRLFVESL
jgi:hypothetical protein